MFIAKFRDFNDYNTQNLFNRFVFKRDWWVNFIREIFLYSRHYHVFTYRFDFINEICIAFFSLLIHSYQENYVSFELNKWLNYKNIFHNSRFIKNLIRVDIYFVNLMIFHFFSICSLWQTLSKLLLNQIFESFHSVFILNISVSKIAKNSFVDIDYSMLM